MVGGQTKARRWFHRLPMVRRRHLLPIPNIAPLPTNSQSVKQSNALYIITL